MDKITDGRTLAQAMVDTVRESLLVLDDSLSVIAAQPVVLCNLSNYA